MVFGSTFAFLLFHQVQYTHTCTREKLREFVDNDDPPEMDDVDADEACNDSIHIMIALPCGLP